MALTIALCVVFIFSTQVVSSLANSGLKFNLTDVQQCEPLVISFTGKQKDTETRLPASLSIIPFDSNPVVVPITSLAVASGGVVLTSLPFPAGTNFIASLDDTKGNNIVKVSDVMRVLPSESETPGSCLPSQSDAPPTRHFRLEGTPSQCQEFSVSYNSTQAPRIRILNPKGFSFMLNQTSDDPVLCIARYKMNVSRGKEIVLLLDGGNGIRETTALLTVAGDSSNPSDCLERQTIAESSTDNTKSPVSSKAVLIGSASGGGAVVLIAVGIAIFILHDRRRRRQNGGRFYFEPSRMQRLPDEKPRFNPGEMAASPVPSGTVPNPEYTSGTHPAPRSAWDDRKDGISSWAQGPLAQQRAIPKHKSLVSLAQSESRNVLPQSNDDRLSLYSLDIEGMLNMATIQSESRSRKSSVPLGYEVTSASPRSPPPLAQVTLAPREWKTDVDIPHSATRSAYSFDSINPFVSQRPSSPHGQSPLFTHQHQPSASISRGPPPGSPPIGLPSSPRDALIVRGRISIARSNRSSSDWYGIGIAR